MSPVRSRKRAVHITDRDLRIMEHLVIRRVETLDAIHEEFFSCLTRKRALNRLGELVAGGFLHRVRLAVPDRLGGPEREQSVYTLGPRARAAIELRSPAGEHFRFRRFNPTLRDSSIPHQVATNRIVDLLRADQVPEHLMPPAASRDAMRNKPDALWERPDPIGGTADVVLLEVDLGHYSRERILGKARTFATSSAREVLLVVPTRTRVRQVSRWLDEGSVRRDSIHLMTFTELLHDAAYYADRYGSHPIHDPNDPVHWQRSKATSHDHGTLHD